jgi:serine/threonine protein kinase
VRATAWVRATAVRAERVGVIFPRRFPYNLLPTKVALTTGTRIGPYEVTGLLGAGGMGEVYKARDTRLGRTVAIKVLADNVAADPELKQRFEREARTLAALSHPHICPVFDVGTEQGIDFLVMEYLEGEKTRMPRGTGKTKFCGRTLTSSSRTDPASSTPRLGAARNSDR